jgi:hypothetical protein
MKLSNTATDDNFWQMVADMGWVENACDYEAIDRKATERLIAEYGVQQAAEIGGQLVRACMQKEHDLRQVIARHPLYRSMYGDSLDDFVAHIVGKGRGYYEQVMADPTVAKDLDYKESFAYCFHGISGIGRSYDADSEEE